MRPCVNIDHVTADICSIVNVSYQTVRLELLSEYLGSNEGKEEFHGLVGSTSCNVSVVGSVWPSL